MPTVTGFTAERMKQIEDQAIVDARLEAFNLLLIRHNQQVLNVGNIRGEQGPRGLPGVDAVNELIWKTGTQLAGTAATGGGDAQTLRMIGGSVIVTTNVSGDATITYPQAFTNGVGSVLAQVASGGGLPDVAYTHLNSVNYPDSSIGLGNIQVVPHNFELNNFRVRLFYPGGTNPVFGNPTPDAALGGCGPVRINYMAFGW